MKKQKDIVGVLLSRLIGFAVLLVGWGIINIIAEFYREEIFLQLVCLFNNNIELILIFTILFFFSDLLSTFKFPFNLLYPPFNAVGSVFIIAFIFQILTYVENIIDVTFTPLKPFAYFLIILVFFIVLISGYVSIFRALIPTEDVEPKKISKKATKKTSSGKEDVEWKDVGKEFKGIFYDIFRNIRRSINKK